MILLNLEGLIVVKAHHSLAILSLHNTVHPALLKVTTFLDR